MAPVTDERGLVPEQILVPGIFERFPDKEAARMPTREPDSRRAILRGTRLAAGAPSAMVAAWVAPLPPPLSGGIAVVVTAALLPAPLGSVQGVPPDQCPVGSHSLVS